MKSSITLALLFLALGLSSTPSLAADIQTGSKELACRYRDSIAQAMVDESHQNHWSTRTEWTNFYKVLGSDFKNTQCTECKSEGITEGTFTYFLKYGQMPTRDFWGVSALMKWIVNRPYWRFHTDAKVLSNLLGLLYCPTEEQDAMTSMETAE